MPTGQQYSSTAPQINLVGGINNSQTTATVTPSFAGWPATPFTGTIDLGQPTQEIVDVISVSGTAITSMTRGVDGSSAQSHSNNATFTHTDIGRDFREMRAHIDAAASNDSQGHPVHGLANGSSVVGTTDTQTLTNKTLTSPVITGMNSANANLTGTVTGAAQYQNITAGTTTVGGVPFTAKGLTNQTGDLLDVVDNSSTVLFKVAANGATGAGATTVQPSDTGNTSLTVKSPGASTWPFQIFVGATELFRVDGAGVASLLQGPLSVSGITGAVNASRYVGATTGGPPVSGTFAVGDYVVDRAYGIHWTCVTAGSPGTWNPSGPALIQEIQPTAGSNINFTSIPQYFKHLRIVGSASANNATTLQDLDLQFNGDTAGNYGNFGGFVSNASASGGGYSGNNTNQAKCGILWGNANPEGATFDIVIPNYSRSDIWKNFHFTSAATQWNITTSYNVCYGGGAWHNNTTPTQAITSILLFPAGGSGFVATSQASLFGLA